MISSRIYRSLFFTLRTPPRAYFSSSSAATSESQRQLSMTSVETFVDSKIADNKIVVFSKSYCPHSNATKQYFASKYPKETVEIVELDEREDGNAIQNYLLKKTGARSVPRTFISGDSVGGNDALQAKSKSEVDALIAKRS